MEGLITNGQAQISGNFTETSANDLATSLKFGALPISFSDEVQSSTIGPSLAGNQLSAGLTAGLFGLLLVMIYCLFYYRGLGLVVHCLAARGRWQSPTRWCCCSARPPTSPSPCPVSPV